MYDICFIVPKQDYLVEPNMQAPLGILYLAAICENTGLSVSISNDNSIPKAKVYGISGTYFDTYIIEELVSRIRVMSPNSRILIGGPITISYTGDADSIFKGEAENSIVDLFFNRPTIATVSDINNIPYPARHLWPGKLGKSIFIGKKNYFGDSSTTFLTMRGCPYSCSFCSSPALRITNKLRFRNPDDVIQEMELIVKDFGIRQFRLSDEFFTCNLNHVHDVCSRILKSKLLKNIAWRTSIGVRPCNKEIFELMHEAGCKEVSIGIETTDPSVLNKICDKGNVDDGEKILQILKSIGIQRRVLLMIGLPETTINTQENMVNFINKQNYEALAITIFTPLPGSQIFEHPEKFHCKLRNIRRESTYLYNSKGRTEIEPTIEVEGITNEELKKQMLKIISAAEQTGKLGKG